MANFDFGKLPSELGNLPSELCKLAPKLTLFHYQGEQCLDEIFEWAWDNDQFDCKALEESVKSEDRANMLRLLGNECYKAKDYSKALGSYNQSIMAAPHPVLSNVKIEETEDNAEFGFPRIDPARYGGVAVEECSALGKGFANRSAVMLDIGEYGKCLEDIALALEHGYPEELRPKLEARRLKCQESQRKEKVSNDTRRNFFDNLQRFALGEVVKNMEACSSGKPPVLKDPNPCIPAFSRAVKVSYWPNKGRGLVATRDIKPGEVLGVERAFAVALLPNLLPTNCSTCTLPCVNPLPCPGCSKVVFCSKPCQLKGLLEDHWLECKILSSIIVHRLETMALSYKLLKTCNFSQIKSMYNKLKRDKPSRPEQLGFDKSGKYNSSSFQSVYHLCQGLETINLEEVILLCMATFRLAKLLELSKRFFVDESGRPVPVTKEDILYICKILVNNHVKFTDSSYGSQVIELYPASGLINHSCSPVMSSKRFHRETVWFAARPIAAGEELTICYLPGADFSIQPKQQRKQYLVIGPNFLCSCQACEENWPTFPHLPDVRWLCVSCSKLLSGEAIHCNECLERLRGNLDGKEASELRIISEKLMSAVDFIHRMRNKVALGETMSKQECRRLCESSEVIFKYSAMPSKLLVDFVKLMDVCAENRLMW